MKLPIDELKRLPEVQSCPALAALLGAAAKDPGGHDLGSRLIEALTEEVRHPAENGDDLITYYAALGEIQAALVVAEARGYPNEKLSAEANRWRQLVEDRKQQLNGMLLVLAEFGGERTRAIDRSVIELVNDSFLLEARPGLLIRKFDALVEELGRLIQTETKALRDRRAEVRNLLRKNPSGDAERALEKADKFLEMREGLPTAKRFLDIAHRALKEPLGADDLRALSESGDLSYRKVRARSELGEGIRTAADAIRWLHREAASLPSEFDQQKLDELLREMTPRDGRLRTEAMAKRLLAFLGLPPKSEPERRSLGTILAVEFTAPRVPALRKKQAAPDAAQLAIPLKADPAAIQQFVASLGDIPSLRIVLLAGRREDLRTPGPTGRMAYVDLVDLLRLAQCPFEERSAALQQVMLPQLSPKLFSPYQQGGPVAPELFRGRREVIERLSAPRGRTILFSGRMMGKSSILAKIDSDIATRDPGRVTDVCVRISSAGDDPVPGLVAEVARAMGAEGRAFEDEETKLRGRMNKGRGERRHNVGARLENLRKLVKRITQKKRLTLLIDEADRFAEAEADVPRQESVAWTLRDLEFESAERLRVVFAGFQSIHRELLFKNGAFANWYGLETLGPLEEPDARALVLEPFADFGFAFASEECVKRILGFTGRHPLLLHETCIGLMERMMIRRRTSADEAVVVSTSDVETVCRDPNLRDRLFQVLSLNLEEPRLRLVLYLVLWASARVDPSSAISLESFELEKLRAVLLGFLGGAGSENFDERSVGALLRELQALGLLSLNGESYRFENRTFASMLLDTPHFDDQLESLLEKVADPGGGKPRRIAVLPTEALVDLQRSEDHELLVGLPGTRSRVLTDALVGTLAETVGEGSDALRVDATNIASLEALTEAVRKQLGERPNRPIDNMLSRAGRRVLCLEEADKLCESDAFDRLLESLASRKIRVIAIGGASVVMSYLDRLFVRDDVVIRSLKRLRVQDIRRWGDERGLNAAGATIILDAGTAERLREITGGHMALLTRFATWIVKSARGSKEVLPTTKQIERFDIELTAEAVQNELFDALSGDAAGLLRRLYRFASDLESESVPWGFFGEEEKRAGGPEWALDDLEVLRYLDLVQVDEAAEEMAVTIELRGPIAKAFGGGSVPA